MAYKSPLRKELPAFETDYGEREYSTLIDIPQSDLGNSMQSFTSLGSLSSDSDNSDAYVNPARAARQKGRQERRKARQDARAARITSRNVERLEKTNERIKAMSDSPNNFVDPTMASVGVEPQMTYQPPMPANQMGIAKPIFNPAVQASAEAIYGTPMQRQMSVDSPYKMKSPLEGNAFIGAKMAAEKAGESTFEVDGKTFNVK